MCVYHYCYFSACRHGQLTRISYCDKVPAPGSHFLGRHSQDKTHADSSPRDQYAVSPPRQPTTKANNSSSPRMNTQHQRQSQHNTTVPMITPSEAGPTPALHTTVHNQNGEADDQAASTSHSGHIEEDLIRRENMLNYARSLLDSQGLSDISIGIASNPHSSLQIETDHDVSLASPPSASGYSIDSNVSRTTDSSWEWICERFELEPVAHTIEQPHQSPRKPIPTQWLPKAAIPNLATAQRAKERIQKKGPEGSSLECARTIRATRSSADLDRSHSKAGGTYLTKEALAAVKPIMATNTTPKSPVKISSPSSKPAWNSPTSPLRAIARQQSGTSLKMSPPKSSHTAAISVKAGRSRGSSNVTASTSKSSFHAANDSPVRNPASTKHVFRSAVENPGLSTFALISNADSGHEQACRDVNTASVSRGKASGESQVTLSRAKVALHISIPNMDIDHNLDSGMTSSKTANDSGSNGSVIPASLKGTSSMPRVGATAKSPVSSHIPASQRTKSPGTITTKAKVSDRMRVESNEKPLSHAPASDISHDRVDENNTLKPTSFPSLVANTETKEYESTPDLVSRTQLVKHAHFYMPSRSAEDLTQMEPGRLDGDDHHSESNATEPCSIPAFISEVAPESESSRQAPSGSSRPRLRDVTDPVLIDSAVIYSRKRSENFDIGSTCITTASSNVHPSTVEHAVVNENTSTAQETGEGHPHIAQDQVDKKNSTPPSICSDLRATATEFVPNRMPTSGPNGLASEPGTSASLQNEVGLPNMAVLDRNGIPFLWYMYGIQFAYEQGCRNGRSRSPRKSRPRKPRGSLSSFGDPLHTRSQDDLAISAAPTIPHFIGPRPRLSRSEHTPLDTVNVQGLYPSEGQEDIQSISHDRASINGTECTAANQAFASQFDEIAGYNTMGHDKSTNTPRHYNIDFARVQNAGFPTSPRNTQGPFYRTSYRQDYRNNRRSGNGLYGGRGNAAGIPIGATAPFPNPVPPQGRPDQIQPHSGIATDCSGYAIGKEACGMVDIACATELIGGGPCNACDSSR